MNRPPAPYCLPGSGVGVVGVGADVLRGSAGAVAVVPGHRQGDLIRSFTLTPADVAFVDPGRGRGPANRLGLAVQLATLPWLGFVPVLTTPSPSE